VWSSHTPPRPKAYFPLFSVRLISKILVNMVIPLQNLTFR
jgi:hypothetical protein